MKEFNLELAKAGHPVCTRDGRKARIICFDRKHKEDKFPIVALVTLPDTETEFVELFNTEGISYDSTRDYDLMMSSVKHEGWVNIYKSNDVQEDLDPFALYQMQQGIFETKDEALGAVKKSIKFSTYIATVKIEWEE